jgi:UDP-N-acetylglucosamine--N-acetylmuramyl-(pentapeptide) pyrophosphoryl-undecaprenol N-acetylglucosamine transferase
MQRIIMSGGGSTGHIAPAIAVAQELERLALGFEPIFVCANRSDEIRVLSDAHYAYRTIHAGKFPRGFSFRVLTFPILLLVAFVESCRLLLSLRPVLIFSKGGYVSVPTCIAAVFLRIPIVLHASDSVPSLSDKFIGRFARRICTGFPADRWPQNLQRKIIVTGNPVRAMILAGSRDAGVRITGFSGRRPVLLVVGGSQGSVAINQAVDTFFSELIDTADIIHLTGEGKELKRTHARYWSRPYVTEELPHLFALADLVVTRASASVLSELSALSKAAILIPLAGVAHDHQVHNAFLIADAEAAVHLPQERISELPSVVRRLLEDTSERQGMAAALTALFPRDAAQKIAQTLLDVLAKKQIQS